MALGRRLSNLDHEEQRVKKDYRTSYRILLTLFLLSFSANLIALALYLKERKAFSFFSKPSSVSSSLLQKPKGVQNMEGTQILKTVKETIPFSLILIENKGYSLICEKNSKTLNLYRSGEGAFSLVKTYPCLVGSNNGDKKKEGDLATPEGIYFLTSSLTGRNLPEKYGSGAFSLNYPNFLDRKEGKRGSGIWLHGCPDKIERASSSEGCVVVRDEVLKELAGFIRAGDTPLVIVDAIRYRSPEDQQKALQSLSHFLNEWQKAWESRNTEKYLGFYSQNFVGSNGMNYQKFKEYKHRVNSSKKFIHLQIERKSFLLSQKDGGHTAVLRIRQDYRSDNFASQSQKILYLEEEQGKWKIIGEITL